MPSDRTSETAIAVSGRLAQAYERLLMRLSAGCIAWSPYLAGRALTLGAPRAMTAASWADAPLRPG